MEQHPPDDTPRLASKELIKKQSLELMRQLQEKNNPAQPFITVFGEGEDQMVILNKPIDILKEGGKSSSARLMITSAGIVALEALGSQGDYLNGEHGVRAARKEGHTINATIEPGYGNNGFSLLISPPDDSLSGERLTAEEKEQKNLIIRNRQHLVPVLDIDFQNGDKIQQAIRESHQEAKDLDQPKIKLLTGLNDFARTLGENPSATTPPQPSAGTGPTA